MYLVTGGSGYFGEVMVQKLLEKGKKVRIFDLNPPNTYLRNKVEEFIGDITNISSINEACKNIDCVFHNVAQVPLAKNEKLFYYVLIEPKGPQLINTDSFKEVFLEQINKSFGVSGEALHANNFEYKIIGLPFYVSKNSIDVFNSRHKLPNQDDRYFENFDESFKELLKVWIKSMSLNTKEILITNFKVPIQMKLGI